MTLDELLQSACSYLGGIDPDTEPASLEREAAALRLKLRRGYDGLMRQRRLVENGHHHIVKKRKDIQALTCRVDSYLQANNQIKAWHAALELDRLRQGLERDLAELGRLQRCYHDLIADLSRMERRAGQINAQLEAQRAQPASAG